MADAEEVKQREAQQVEFHLAILGPRQSYQATAKNYTTNDVENTYLKKEEVLSWCLDLNQKGYVAWLSINDKEKDCKEGVTALNDFWLEIDARPKGVDDRTATEQELLTALDRANKLKNYIENQYAALGFMATSGNGFHIHFPLPRFELPPELRLSVNTKVKTFAVKVSAFAQVDIDKTYDISRKTTLIGTPNLKIPDKPLATKWDKDLLNEGIEAAIKYVENARMQNTNLLDTILKTEPEKEPKLVIVPNENHLKIEQLLEQDRKLEDLLKGDWQKYNYKSRSEAEEAVLVKLVMEGFSDVEINGIMETCQIGKWQEKQDSYKILSLEHARGQTNNYMAEKRQKNQAASEHERKSQADKLVALCLLQDPTLFIDQTGMPFAWINQKGANVTLPLRSRLFKSWLSSLLWEAEQKAPGNEAISSASNILVSKATFEGPRITLYNRVAPGENCFWLDMTDDKHRAIKVTAQGWTIVDDPPILFKRYSHQLPLAIPVRGCDLWRLLDFFNIATVEEEKKKLDSEDALPNTRLVMLCDCVSFLIPTIPHPLLLLYGIQGSGKSLIFKLIKRLLDPSSIEVLTLPKNENERIQQLEHHWLAFYDNITHLPSWMSDTLCRAVTGSGFSKRELYSDDDDVIYAFKRCVGLNGINIAAQTGDLLDRAVLVGMVNIEKEKRRTEEELCSEFEKCKPEILGAFLDVLVKAMQLYPQLNPTKLFRMADFTKWGCAISQALGKTAKEFLDAYELKVKAQIEEAAHASPVATVLLDSFSIAKEPWEGTPTQLYIRLNEHAKMLGISTRQKAWPKAPNVLVRQLNELAPSLKSLGLDIETGIREGHDATRRIRVSTVSTVRTHEKNGKTADDNADDSKNEPSALKHGQSTLAVDADGKFPTSTRALAKWGADAPQQREQKKTTSPPDKTSDKVLTDVDPKPVQQNEPNPLVSFEMTSKTQAECVFDLADAAKLEPKKGITRKANSEEWIEKREDNRVFAKSGEVMFQCQFCKAQDKPLFFTTEHDLELHVKAFHDPDKLPRKFQEVGMAFA